MNLFLIQCNVFKHALSKYFSLHAHHIYMTRNSLSLSGQEAQETTVAEINYKGTRSSTYLRQAEQFTFCIPLISQIWIQTWTKISSACSCHLPNSSTKFCHYPSTTFCNIMILYWFWPHLSVVKNQLKIKILVSRSGSSPESNQFVLVTHPTCPPNFVRIHPWLFEKPAHRQTNKKKTSCRARYLQNP